MFEAALVSNDGGTLTSTLINLSEVSVLDDSNVTCLLGNNDNIFEIQQRISVADLFYISNSVYSKHHYE